MVDRALRFRRLLVVIAVVLLFFDTSCVPSAAADGDADGEL